MKKEKTTEEKAEDIKQWLKEYDSKELGKQKMAQALKASIAATKAESTKMAYAYDSIPVFISKMADVTKTYLAGEGTFYTNDGYTCSFCATEGLYPSMIQQVDDLIVCSSCAKVVL